MDTVKKFIIVHCIVVTVLLLVAAYVAYGESPGIIVAPNGSITYVYPGARSGSPAVVIPQSGSPTIIYPSTRPGQPTTILPPSQSPSFYYPPPGADPIPPVLPSPSYGGMYP